MSRDLVTIESEQNCRWALQVMSAADIGRLPVLAGDRLVGIVTEQDIRRRAPALGTQEAEEVLLANVNVGGVMSCFPVTVAADASIAEATTMILAHDVSTLPVIEKGRLVGILTLRDLLRAFSEMFGIVEAADPKP
jgi:acetoin utilization protein AcuB